MNRQLSVRRITSLIGVFLVLGIGPFVSSTAADMFGSGANSFEIEFVTIGQPGNPPDANPNPARFVNWLNTGHGQRASRLVRKEIGCFDFQGRGQRGDYQERGIAFATLDSPDIGPMMFRPGGKLLLAPTTFLAECAQPLTEFSLHRLHLGMKPG